MGILKKHRDILLATVDIGSNSFHLLIARVQHGEMRPVATRSEKVQLAAGLNKGVLDDEAITRGLCCLTQFRQMLDIAKPDVIRVVATNTLRIAKNSIVFENAAVNILGQRVEIISGREEARLVYLGVAHTLADDGQARLVIDIGGGSTEVIIGERFESKVLESLHMGCVSYRELFFAKGKITVAKFEKAYQRAYLEVLNIRKAFYNKGWSEVVGSAGTLNTIATVLNEKGHQSITVEGLELLKHQVCEIGTVDGLKEISGLKIHRCSTFPGGLAICSALFDALSLTNMQVSPGALREGLGYDLIGRMKHEDVRERTVLALMKRCGVDESNAARVEQFAGYLFDNARVSWHLSDVDGELLCWAARLHEVGLSVAHSQFHKHGQYLIKNGDLPGFSQPEKKALAILVRCHRRKFTLEPFAGMAEEERQHLQRLCILLRLAVVFKYVLPIESAPNFRVLINKNCCTLEFATSWLDEHPLTQTELEAEQAYLQASAFDLLLR